MAAFLTRLLLVTLLSGSCFPQNAEDFILLTLESIAARQDTLLQKVDELENNMERKIDELENNMERKIDELENKMEREIDESVNPLEENIRFIDKTTQDILRKILLPQCQRMINASNCKEVLDNGCMESGVYTITPKGFSEGVQVYCDQLTDGGGWTVILQRKRPAQIPFSMSFEAYAAGFGNPNGELWIGNRVLHAMTGDEPYTLRVEATGVEGQYRGGTREEYGGGKERHGIWQNFSVGSEHTQFTLSIGGYSDSSSTLGDALTGNPLRTDNNMQFSTYDRDNDRHSVFHCSVELGNYGWWINNCGDSSPTGKLVDTFDSAGGARWDFWNKRRYTSQLIKEIQFKIRP